MRLALHLWTRVRGEPEDGRYQHLRAHWHGDQLKFFAFFQFQALLIVLFALPFIAVARNPRGVRPCWLPAAVAIWLVSVVGEAIADRAAGAFRSDPANRGHTCRDGLWRYSRHPNYFFEWLHWFAYVCLAVGSPLALAGLVRAAGDVRVPALDQRHAVHRGAGAAQPRRRLPRLPAHHLDADSLVSEEDRAR